MRKNSLVWAAVVGLAVAGVGCGDNLGLERDSALPDTGMADTGMADTGMADTGMADTGMADAGGDGATPVDGDLPADTAVPDAQPPDATLDPDAQIITPPTISISDVSVAEGDTGPSNATFTVTLSAAAQQTITVAYATANGSATVVGGDYAGATGTVTFDLGDLSKTITVVVNGDTLDEADETFAVNLSSPVNATIADGAGAGTIVDDDAAPAASIADVTVLEGNTGTSNAVFVVTLSAASAQTITMQFASADGAGGTGATASSDYTASTGTLTFNPGETSKTISVPVAGDTTAEPSETFTVTLTTPVNVSFARAVATGTIQNDDGAALPSLGISDVTQAEGNAGTTTFTFTVSLSFASTQVVTVQFASIDGAGAAGAISGGSASSGGRDYDASNGTVSFAIGETSKTISITVNGDLLDEDAESFQVVLSGAVNAVIADAIGVGTISNDDTAPTIVINSVSVTEGATGVRPATFTATLSGPSGRPVSVNYASADGSATAGGVAGSGGQDYAAALGSISFAPGQTTQTISVIVNGDTLDEADETFTVTLSAPVNATLGTPATGTGTITDDDAPPALLISDTRVIEGNTGMATLNFTVGLTAPSGQTVTVQYASADGTATLASSDYMQASGTLTFAPGTSTTQLVAVQVVGDTMTEGNENLTVTLSSPVNATITRATGTGTIINDDGALPIIGISNGQTNEGGMVTFTLVLSMPSATPVTVQYATQDGSATDGADYTAASGTVTFPAGQQMQQVMITTLQDGLDEANETFTVNLSSASGNASIGVGTGTGTIIDNDDQPSLAINDSSVTEGNSGTTVATFTVTLSAASGRTVTVNYSTANGTAQSGGTLAAGGQDYVSTSGTLSFAPGETSKTIMVTINGDTTFEQTERYGVLLAGASNASVSDGQGQGTITNDDTQPTLSINDVAHSEGTGATPTAFVFTVTLSNPSVQTVTVTFNTMAGTAAQFGVNADLLPQLGQLSFPPGVTTQTITVNVLADAVTEQDETFSVVLSMPMGATITDNSGLGTIGNDD